MAAAEKLDYAAVESFHALLSSSRKRWGAELLISQPERRFSDREGANLVRLC